MVSGIGLSPGRENRGQRAKFKSGYLPGGLLKAKRPTEVLRSNPRKLFFFFPLPGRMLLLFWSLRLIPLGEKWREMLGRGSSHGTLGGWQGHVHSVISLSCAATFARVNVASSEHLFIQQPNHTPRDCTSKRKVVENKTSIVIYNKVELK